LLQVILMFQLMSKLTAKPKLTNILPFWAGTSILLIGRQRIVWPGTRSVSSTNWTQQLVTHISKPQITKQYEK
jgi:hypothetical protein